MAERRLVWALAITQTVGYGVLYYSFPVLLDPMVADLRASAAAVTGALTTSIAVSALLAVPVGRWLDRRGGRALMTVGSAIGVAAVLLWSQAQTLAHLYVAFVLVGVASALSLYEAAFATIVAASAPERRGRALLAVTVVAGFASSVFFPLTGWLVRWADWQSALVVLAVLLATVAVPGHLLSVPARRTHVARQGRAAVGRSSVPVQEALRDPDYWRLTAAFVIHGAAIASMAVLLVSYLTHLGHRPTTAATIAGLLGLLSVAGRLLLTGIAQRYGMIKVTAIIFAVQAAGAAALPIAGGTALGAAVCVTAFGIGFGVATIARPATLADRYGSARYGTIAATMVVPLTVAKAGGPLAAAVVDPNVFVYSAAAACLLGSGLLRLVGPPAQCSAWSVRRPVS